MPKKVDTKKIERKIKEALKVLESLGFPRQQQNERSALTLLSLLDLKPDSTWRDASDPLMGITPMMDYFAEHYGKQYAPNTRETVRRQTVHQFLQAALIVANPGKPSRPTNSPKAVYQIEPAALKLLREFGKPAWAKHMREYLRTVKTLKALYARERDKHRIPVTLALGKEIRLSPGGQNVLVKKIIDDFCPLFTPGGHVIYVGDTQTKWAYFDSDALDQLDVNVEEHGKMPDVVVHHTEKNWLVLIEAVTSHGPVNPKRRQELKELFAGSKAGLVYVTAFNDRRTMIKYLDDISWETEVWIAESKTHLIHFNGDRFLGPHED
jgi:type II restriction enzyme